MGALALVTGRVYQAVVVTVLLYGSNSYVIPPSGVCTLEGSRVECVQCITGMRPVKRLVKSVYPKLVDVLKAVHLKTVRWHIGAWCANIQTTIMDWPIFEKSRGSEGQRRSPPLQF